MNNQSCFRVASLQWKFISKSGSRTMANAGEADERNLVNNKAQKKPSIITDDVEIITRTTLIKSSSTMESKV